MGTEFSVIIPAGTILPVNRKKRLFYYKNFNFKNENNLIIKIYAGNNQNVSDNVYLGEFKLDNDSKDIKIAMSLEFNFILKVIIFVKDKINNQIEIPFIKELII